MSELTKIDNHSLLGLFDGFEEKRAAARDEIERRLNSVRECAKVLAEQNGELSSLRAEIEQYREIIPALLEELLKLLQTYRSLQERKE